MNARLPCLAAISRQNMRRLGTKFEQEAGKTKTHVWVAVDSKLLAVDVRIRIGNRVDQATTLLRERIRDWLPGDPRYFHEELVCSLDTDRVVKGDGLLFPFPDIGEGLFQQNSCIEIVALA